MIATDCSIFTERASLFVNGALPDADAQEFETHLEGCEGCQENLRQIRAVHGLMEYIEAEAPAATGEAVAVTAPRVSLAERLSGAPWWLVSCALHVLVISLAGLITMAVELPKSEDAVIMVTELQQRPTIQEEKPKEKGDVLDALQSSKIDPTDPTSKEAINVNVPPDILAKAELGDHFETINPDRPDTHSAFGNPDATSFHSVTGSVDNPGGGGTGGVSMEDVVGVGAAGTRGTGGGFGGGDGSGVGNQSGAGKGSFGSRTGGGRKLMVKRNGGSPATESAVDHGLDWLARNQEADGHWDSAKFGAAASVADTADCACSGFALLAFVGAGHTEKVGKYKDTVCKAVNWFKTKQNGATGAYCISNYGHAIALMGMAEAAGMGRIPDTIESAQKGVDCTVGKDNKGDASSERGGWGYGPMQHRTMNGDMSNSGWSMMALKSAKVANLKVPFEAIEGCRAFLSACEIGKVAGDSYSGNMFGYAPDPANKGAEPGRAICNSIGLLGRLFFGTPANELENGAANMIKVAGLPNGKGVKVNAHGLYYLYYATLVTFQVGGDTWKTWNESLRETIPPMQIKGGADDGSWNPDSAMSDRWGRVGQTALSILCMEVYYRYQRLAH